MEIDIQASEQAAEQKAAGQEVYAGITSKYPDAENFWGVSTQQPEGTAEIPAHDLPIQGMADMIGQIKTGAYGAKAKALVEDQFKKNPGWDDMDAADYIQSKIKEGSFPNFPLFVDKKTEFAQWYEARRQRKGREMAPEPYVDQNPGAISWSKLNMKGKVYWVEGVYNGEISVGQMFRREVIKLVDDADGDYNQAAHDIGQMPRLSASLKVTDTKALQYAKERSAELEARHELNVAEETATKKAEAVKAPATPKKAAAPAPVPTPAPKKTSSGIVGIGPIAPYTALDKSEESRFNVWYQHYKKPLGWPDDTEDINFNQGGYDFRGLWKALNEGKISRTVVETKKELPPQFGPKRKKP